MLDQLPLEILYIVLMRLDVSDLSSLERLNSDYKSDTRYWAMYARHVTKVSKFSLTKHLSKQVFSKDNPSTRELKLMVAVDVKLNQMRDVFEVLREEAVLHDERMMADMKTHLTAVRRIRLPNSSDLDRAYSYAFDIIGLR